jgi:hypothetical protein
MSQQLSDDEKRRLAEEAAQRLTPLLGKYELDEKTGMMALYEAFQHGIQFAIQETKRLEQEVKSGHKFLK